MEHESERVEVYIGLWWGTYGKGPLIRPRRRRDNILNCIFKIQNGEAELIDLAQDGRWRNFVNTVMKLWVA